MFHDKPPCLDAAAVANMASTLALAASRVDAMRAQLLGAGVTALDDRLDAHARDGMALAEDLRAVECV
ncbi:MAG TPA: hypothetical protein VIT92_00625 [Burkholderiaceae bacterium]